MQSAQLSIRHARNDAFRNTNSYDFNIRDILATAKPPTPAIETLIMTHPECAQFWKGLITECQRQLQLASSDIAVIKATENIQFYTRLSDENQAKIERQLELIRGEEARIKQLSRNMLACLWNSDEISKVTSELIANKETLNVYQREYRQANNLRDAAQKGRQEAEAPFLERAKSNLIWGMGLIESYPDRARSEIEATSARSFIVGYNATLIHGIHPSFIPHYNSILDAKATFRDKLLLALVGGERLTLCCSSLKYGDGARNAWSQIGVLIGDGLVEYASCGDGGSRASLDGSRTISNVKGFADIGALPTEIERAHQRITGYRYNEFGISTPKITGLYFIRDLSLNNPHSITDEDMRSFAAAATELGLPVFVIQDGRVYRASFAAKKLWPQAIGEPLKAQELASLPALKLQAEVRGKYLQELSDRNIAPNSLLSSFRE